MTETAEQLRQRVQASFNRQGFMQRLNARLVEVSPGEVLLETTFDESLSQQHGYFHAAVVTALLDSASGYAALSMMPPGSDVLSVEFKVNLMAPAKGETLRAHARVVRSGRTLTVCSAEATVAAESGTTPVALMQATMMRIEPRNMR